MGNDMNCSIKMTVKGFSDPCYILDKDAKVVDYNDAYAELVGVKTPEIIGKKLSDTKIHFNHKIERDSVELMMQHTEVYRSGLEVYYDPSGRLGEVMLESHKMLIHDAQGDVIGMLCRMRLTEGNNKIELQLKECLNALRGYTQFLVKEDCFMGQLDAIEGAKSITDNLTALSLELTGGKVPFWERVYKRTKANDFASYYFYSALIIYDEIDDDIRAALQSSYYFQFDMVTHADAIKDQVILAALKNKQYHLIITDVIDPKIKALTLDTCTCYFGIKTKSGAIHQSIAQEYFLPRILAKDDLAEVDKNVFVPWRHHVANLVKEKVSKLGSLKVLYVEDDDNSRVSFERLVSICPYIGESDEGQCVGVSTPSEAIKAVKKDEFDIIIVDVGLPEMDGFELATQIRRIQWQKGYLTCPIYGYTGHIVEHEQYNIQCSGMDKLFLKPSLAIDINQILRAIVPEGALI